MTKYKCKDNIEAAIYEKGMEDGLDPDNISGLNPYILNYGRIFYIKKADYIIKTNSGRYPVNKDIFHAIFEQVEEPKE